MKETDVVYFHFPLTGPACMHRWISGVQHVVKEELDTTLKCLTVNGMATPDREEIIIYLHHLYFYRFALPAIEACFSSKSEYCDPTLVRFQLLSCLLGRFIDDTVDRDSGFWSTEEASFWVKEFSRRCESTRKELGGSKEASEAWFRCIELASTPSIPLFQRTRNTAGLCIPNVSPLPIKAYPDRVPYYFWLPRWHGTHPVGTAWLESYIQTLFYWYDIEDILNDILNNVPTDPAYQFLRTTLDSEGRIKCRGACVEQSLAKLRAQGISQLAHCAAHGRKIGLLIGPAMIDREVHP